MKTMRILFSAWLLLFTVAPTICQTITNQPPAFKPEIRIPSITPRWKREGDNESPEITIEEIERCIGQDVDMQHDLNLVKSKQAELEPERAEIERLSLGYKQRSSELESNRMKLQELSSRIETESVKLSQQLVALEKRKSTTPKSQAEVNAINAQVSSYNSDVVRFNKSRLNLLSDQDIFNGSVDIHNGTLTNFSQRVNSFNEKNGLFQVMVSNLNKKSEQHIANCSGEKLIRK